MRFRSFHSRLPVVSAVAMVGWLIAPSPWLAGKRRNIALIAYARARAMSESGRLGLGPGYLRCPL
jgi:hypothetical protein